MYGYALQNPGRYTDFWGMQSGVFNADGTIGLPGDYSNPRSGSQSLLGGGIKVGTGIAGGIATGILLAITPTPAGLGSDRIPTVEELAVQNNSCGDDTECRKAIAEARYAYGKLNDRIVEYIQASHHGQADAGHLNAVMERRKPLRRALRKVDRLCLVKPPEYHKWRRAAYQETFGKR